MRKLIFGNLGRLRQTQLHRCFLNGCEKGVAGLYTTDISNNRKRQYSTRKQQKILITGNEIKASFKHHC